MIYTVIAGNGQSYDLPVKTLAVTDKLDTILRIDSTKLSLKDKYKKIHEFVKDMIGPENAKEVLGADNIMEIDMGELEVLVLKIREAYDRPVSDYHQSQLEQNFDMIPTEKIVAITKAAETVSLANAVRK